jgi:hypothetical protein
VLRASALFDVENLTFRAHGERSHGRMKLRKAHPAYSNLMKQGRHRKLNKKRK